MQVLTEPLAAALSRYFVEPRRWTTFPGDWRAVFGRDAPLAVEIGFGNGEFLEVMAQRLEDWNFVGFELSLTCLAKAAKRLWRAGVANVRLARVEGRFALRELFPSASVDRVFVNFPCPWPKARHAARRLSDQAFARALAGTLKQGGELILVTDVDWYADAVLKVLEATGAFSLAGPELVEGRGPGTRYENKWRREGRAIFELRAVLVKPAGKELTLEGAMPHVLVKRELRGDDFESLVGHKETWLAGAFVIKEAALSPDRTKVLLRVFATDGGFQQQYFIAASKEAAGWLVKLDGATVPFRTPAVKRSVYRVARLLEKGEG